MMDESIDHRRCDDIVSEVLSPPPERQVRRDQDRSLFIPGRDQLEEQTRRLSIERQRPQLINDQQPGVTRPVSCAGN